MRRFQKTDFSPPEKNLLTTGVFSKQKKMTKYEVLSEIQHVLRRPDTYVGSKHFAKSEEFILSADGLSLGAVTIKKSPAMERTFLEILSNAVDNSFVSPEAKKITVDAGDETISIENDGESIPIAIHPETQLYNHTVIFGVLRSGSNYDDTEERFGSGRNGFGAKLTNILSKEFLVEGAWEGWLFRQLWTDNMKTVHDPLIEKTKRKNFTKVTWKLDFAWFGAEKYSFDMQSLFRTHCLFAAVTTGLNVTFNKEKLSSSILALGKLFADDSFPPIRIKSEGIDALVLFSTAGFSHLSFVNGIRTAGGGRHTDAVVDAVIKPLMETLKAKPRDIKDHLKFIVVASLPNPEFSSQEKNVLTSPKVKVEDISKTQASTIANKWGIKQVVQTKEDTKLIEKAVRKKHVTVANYDRANNIHSNPKECVLFICEGLSAKTFIIQGLKFGMFGKKGRDWFGICPLTGKLLNVAKASIQKITENKVVMNLINILGLNLKSPNDFSSLNYGRVVVCTDADHDGTHIFGLLLNLFHVLFPKFLDFVFRMLTPIKRTKSGQYIYDDRLKLDNVVAYYKGLGTIKPDEVKHIFGKKIPVYSGDTSPLNLAFASKTTDERKEWISQFNPEETIEKEPPLERTFESFIFEEQVQFAFENAKRSIPSGIDGLKESQRKILWSALQSKLFKPKKLTQFSGQVSEMTDYQHGEQNLIDTVIKMAQNFVGSNNVPLFLPLGGFGSRLEGGADAASGRYLNTHLAQISTFIFKEIDMALLPKSTSVEPAFFLPIIPFIFVNGGIGLATGWMTKIPSFNILDLIENTLRWATGKKLKKMIPFYRGFKGFIGEEEDKIICRGVFKEKKKSLEVTELPVGLWTGTFKKWLEENNFQFVNRSTDENVFFEVFDCPANVMEKKLLAPINMKNMVVLDSSQKPVKVSVEKIFEMHGEKKTCSFQGEKDIHPKNT